MPYKQQTVTNMFVFDSLVMYDVHIATCSGATLTFIEHTYGDTK